MLGVLKAGGAYVPLDPTYPQERRDFVAADAAVALVVTAEELADLVPPGIERRLYVDAPEEWSNLSSTRLPDAGGASPGNLAYLIYTSGSTGKPKGVAIEHRNASALLTWALGLFAERETARVLASTSINFDLSIFEIFVPLARGGAVELVENALAMPAEPGSHAGQHRPLGPLRGAARRRPAGDRRDGQPRRRAAAARTGRPPLRRRIGGAGLQPLRPVRGHHLLDLGADRSRRPGRAVDRATDPRHAGLRRSTATSGWCRSARRASSCSAARGSRAATSAART